MPKVKSPITLSQYYGLDPVVVAGSGILDATLCVDTRLFIDPMLLEHSAEPELREAAVAYDQRFSDIVSLLDASKTVGDVAWRSAIKLMQFHEVSANCLGYGAGGTGGSGIGEELINRIATTGKEIVELGVINPALFPLLALIESDIGADRISDMTTSIIIDQLEAFAVRKAGELGIPLEKVVLLSRERTLPVPQPLGDRSPLLLLPTDILRKLPVATDRSEIAHAAAANEALRERVNAHIGGIWESTDRLSKKALKKQILGSAEAVETLIDAYSAVSPRAYDSTTDESGLISWSRDAEDALSSNPITLDAPTTGGKADEIVTNILKQFKFLVEQHGVWKNFWNKERRLPERYSQNLFFAVAYSYCKANNLDVSPEVDTGTGLVDFKFSSGFSRRVLVEIKLTSNPNLVSGFTKQLPTYNFSEESVGGHFVIVNVGGMGKKEKALEKAIMDARKEGAPIPTVWDIDATPQKSASKR